MTDRIIRRKEVEHLTGFKRSTLYRYMALNKFPRSISLGGGRMVGWRLSDIQQWIEEQSANTDSYSTDNTAV
jgi:prophage regulatory protein